MKIMKLNKIILPLTASALLLTGCYDEKMDWHTPEGHTAVVAGDIPLALAEQIANYKNIKEYATEYMPGVQIGLGIGASKYLSDSAYAATANANFDIFTPGNAMKHDAVVANDGSLRVGPGSTVQQFVSKAAEAGIQIYGHNFIWHTQQNQTYLKSLIAPVMKVETDGDIASILTNGDFETGDLTRWSGWGNGSTREVKSGVGVDGSRAAVLVNPTDANEYSAQFCQNLTTPLTAGKTYVIRFKAKSTVAGGIIQFAVQNSSTYAGEGYHSFTIGTDWTTCEYEYACTKDDMNRLCLNFGKVAATYTIDNVEFGEKMADPMTNVLTGDNSDFEGGTVGSWNSWGNSSTTKVDDGGYKSSKCLVLTNPTDANQWSAQLAYTFSEPFINGETYVIQFWAKSDVAGAPLQFQVQNSTTYGSQEGYNTFTLGTEWAQYEYEYKCGKADADRILLNFGKTAAKYYLDNIKFGVKKGGSGAKRYVGPRKATKITYTLKTAEEKREALLGAMRSWIAGMAQACPTVKQWDVVNEPITDGSNLWRGVDAGSWSTDDAEPTESTSTGLNLNWGNNHFYWGYFIGKDYAAKAFQYAREAIGSDARLYVNDYNLEKSPGKLDALIKFVEHIDANGGRVDGIGTQMHLTYNQITQAEVDAMFTKLAATGKLVRVSELDVAMGTATPSVEQQLAQSEVYKMVVESYKKHVPEAQRGGICIWTLSDADDEHTYWIPNDAPNLFDKSYARKIAYKGLCDGIAGFDIGATFNGNQWHK